MYADTTAGEIEMAKINVYNDEHEIVARVEYQSNLDFWDGNNWTCGSTGLHKGITKLKNGNYVLIHGSQWQGSQNYGEIISAKQALQEILSGKPELLNESRFADLATLQDSTLIEEDV